MDRLKPLGPPVRDVVYVAKKPEWKRIPGRFGWWLHRDGVKKTYAPGGQIPDSDEELDINLTTADGQEIIFIKGLKVRNQGKP